MTHLLVLVVCLKSQQVRLAMEGCWKQQEGFCSWLEGWFSDTAFPQDDLFVSIAIQLEQQERDTKPEQRWMRTRQTWNRLAQAERVSQ